MSDTQVQPFLGARKDNVRTREITGDDPFKDAPFYAAGESDSEHINAVPVGATICGVFRRLAESRKANASGSKSWYACLELGEGDDMQRIRLMAPTQLRNVLIDEKVETGTYLELTYKGTKEPVDGGRPYHVWNIKIGETLN